MLSAELMAGTAGASPDRAGQCATALIAPVTGGPHKLPACLGRVRP